MCVYVGRKAGVLGGGDGVVWHVVHLIINTELSTRIETSGLTLMQIYVLPKKQFS